MARKHAICFVDDDKKEIERFCKCLNEIFVIGAGTSIREALDDLKKKKRKKPDLYVLDLYFPSVLRPPSENSEVMKELHEARKSYLKAKINFLSELTKLGQSPEGGFEKAEKLREKKIFRKLGYVFFTRKGTLEDAQRAFKRGALKVIKKPDPTESEMEEAGSISAAYDIAFEENFNNIAGEIEDAIRTTTFWWRYKKYIIGFLLGVISSIVANLIF